MIKKFVITFVIVLLVLFGGKYGYEYYQDNFSSMSKYMKEVNSVSAFEKELASNEVVYVYMGRPNCGDSDMFESYFEGMIKEYKLKDKFVFFNIKDITDNDKEYKKLLFDKFGIRNTPTLAKYENGELTVISEWTSKYGYSKSMAMDFLLESELID